MIALCTLFDKFSRYLLVGGLNTVICLLIMYLGARLNLHYLVYTPMGYMTTILLSFFMNLHYTFQVKDRAGSRLIGFLLVSLVNLAIVELMEYGLIEICSFPRWLAILTGMSWYVLTGFLINNFVIYRHTKIIFE